MKHAMMMVLAAPVALGAATVMAADKPVSFSVGGTRLKMPLPKGFCEPTGRLAAFAERLAAVDSDNDTPVTLVTCGKGDDPAAFENYILVKSPKTAAKAILGKKEGLDLMDKALGDANSPKFDDSLSEDIADSYEREMGTRVQVTGTYGYAGRDADCVYLAGPMSGSANGRTVSGLVVTCVTVAGGKLLAVNLYEMPAKTSIKAMKIQVRAIGVSIGP